MTNAARVQLRVEDGALHISGLPSNRTNRLFLQGVMGAHQGQDSWTLAPRSRSLEQICVDVSRWLAGHGYDTELSGQVDVLVERDRERQLSFRRARDAATLFREGTATITPAHLRELLTRAEWNFDQRELRDHQERAALHALTAANAANFSVPGAGKTATTLAVAAAHVASATIDRVLVIGPLSSFGPWEAETAMCLPQWQVVRVSGTATERRRTIRSAAAGTVLLASYPGAASDSAALKELCRSHRVMLVADESHRIKRFNGGQWAPAVIDIATLASVRMVLSGTPMPQSGLDLFSQLSVLWPGRELTGPKASFKPEVQRQFSNVITRVLPFVSRTSKVQLGLRPPTIDHIDIELGEQESEVYGLLRSHLRRAVEAAGARDADRLAALRRGRPMRLLQAASNASILHDGSPPVAGASTPTLLGRLAAFDASGVVPAKYLRAGEIITGLGEDQKCVVWSNFIRNLDQFAAYTRTELDVDTFQVDGRVAARVRDANAVEDQADDDPSRESVIAAFLAHPGKAVLITNPASCSESISLHSSCRNAIYLDRSYDCAQWLQSIDRIHRLGLPADADVRVWVFRALAEGEETADHLVGTSLEVKEARMRQLLEGAGLEPLGEERDADQGTIEDLLAMISYLLGRDE